MKIKLLALLFFALSLGSAVSQSDETAIRQVIEAESKAFHTSADRTLFMTYWQITPDTRLVYSGPEGSSMITGDQIKGASAAGQLPPVDNAVNEYSNFVVHASGTIGWASLDQKSTDSAGKVSYMHEFRCMEKVGGAWKIVSSSVHEYKP